MYGARVFYIAGLLVLGIVVLVTVIVFGGDDQYEDDPSYRPAVEDGPVTTAPAVREAPAGIEWDVRSSGSGMWVHCDGTTAVYYSVEGGLVAVDNSEHCPLNPLG